MVGASVLMAAGVFVAPAGLGALDASIQACTSWIAEPASWSEGIDNFASNTGLDKSGLVAIASVPEFALPPPAARLNMHHWRVGALEEAYFITASDTAPICHIVGGGTSDLYPSVERFSHVEGFSRLWNEVNVKERGDMKMRSYAFDAEPKIQLVLSHAAKAGSRTDRPQVVATIFFNLED